MGFVSSWMFIALSLMPLSGAAFQVPGRPANTCLHRTNFLPSAEGLKAYQLPIRALAAAVKIELVNAQGKVFDHCSGMTVSQSGDILTAGHCFESCLSEANGYKSSSQGSVVDEQVLTSLKCSVRINGQPLDASLLAVSNCRLAERFKSGSSKVCNGLDYALINVNIKSTDCLPLGDRQVGVGSDVATFGFPTKTYRAYNEVGGRDSDGESQFATGGKTISPRPYCNQKNGSQTRQVPFRADRWPHMERWLNDGTMVQTEEVDLVGGVSGSGLIDLEAGEVVGVAAAAMVNDNFATCSGGSFFVSSRAIFADVAQRFPSVRDRLNSCRH